MDHELEADIVFGFGWIVEGQTVVDVVECFDVLVQVEQKKCGRRVHILIALVPEYLLVEDGIHAQIQIAHRSLVRIVQTNRFGVATRARLLIGLARILTLAVGRLLVSVFELPAINVRVRIVALESIALLVERLLLLLHPLLNSLRSAANVSVSATSTAAAAYSHLIVRVMRGRSLALLADPVQVDVALVVDDRVTVKRMIVAFGRLDKVLAMLFRLDRAIEHAVDDHAVDVRTVGLVQQYAIVEVNQIV